MLLIMRMSGIGMMSFWVRILIRGMRSSVGILRRGWSIGGRLLGNNLGVFCRRSGRLLGSDGVGGRLSGRGDQI